MYENIIKQFIGNYLSLHLHTVKSMNDSILKIDDYIEKAKKLNLKALSITNHGVMTDVFEFYSKCKENEIKPILGCEVYVSEDRLKQSKEARYDYCHLVLLAVNKTGFRNLLLIHNDAQINGFYCKPRTDINILREHGEGIIALSACVGGYIPQLILKATNEDDETMQNEYLKQIESTISEYKNIFDDFYLELQPGNFSQQIIVNSAIVDIAKATNTKTIITNDVHYLDKEDYLAHNIHVMAGRGKKAEDMDSLCYPDKCYYVMTNEEIVKSLINIIDVETIVDSVNNIYNIIEQVEDYDIIPEEIYMPIIDIPEGYTEETYLSDICFKRLEEIKYKIDDLSEYTERLLYELNTLKELHFCGYFLVVRDYVMWCQDNDIMTGPGRGSVVGSLTAYLCGITKIDPIRYGLLFERFLSIYRKGSIPDIDMDIQASERDRVFNYVINKYGKDKCCLVSTFTNRKSKLAIKDTGRVFDIDPEIYNHVADLIPTVYYTDTEDGNTEKQTDISIEEALEIVPELKTYYDEYPDWFNSAIKLSNIPKATSLHAAGTIISPVSLQDKMPLIRSKNEDIMATALNLEDAELIKFIKFDFLSLSTLGVFKKVLKLINKKNLDFIDEAYDDPEVWDLIGSSHTAGLFQIGTNTYKQRMGRLKPRTIEELAACLALVRGPCISNKLDEKYMKILEGKEEVELIHPIYDSVCKKTNGILLYQEQLMEICHNIGFSLEDGYRIMKASNKKKIEKLKAYKKEFMEYAAKINMDEDIAERIFKMIVDSGLYSFNKSHAVSYAVVVYISAYLKVHYTREFLAASLTNAYERKEDPKDLIDECRRYGYSFIEPSINESDWDFKLENDVNIRIGFSAIKSFGYTAYEEVEKNRPFESMEDFLEKIIKKNCSKRAIIPAIFTGCFNDFYRDKNDAYIDFCNLTECEPEEDIYIQGSKQRIKIDADDMELEQAFMGYALLSDPVNRLKPIGIEKYKKNQAFKTIGIISRVKKLKDKNKKQMAFVTLSTGDGTLDVIVFSDKYKNCLKCLKKNMICETKLMKNKDDYIMLEAEATGI